MTFSQDSKEGQLRILHRVLRKGGQMVLDKNCGIDPRNSLFKKLIDRGLLTLETKDDLTEVILTRMGMELILVYEHHFD